MNRYINFAAAVLLIMVVFGCEVASEKKLTLAKPIDQTLNSGGANKFTVTIDRVNFKDPVTVKIEGLPSGVRVEEKEIIIGTDSKTATFTLKAEPTAATVTDNRATVIADAPGITRASETFMVTVTKN